MESFDDFEGMGLLAFGACVQYPNDDSLRRVLTRGVESLAANSFVYVRTTAVSSTLPTYETKFGVYQHPNEYEALFADLGLRVIDRRHCYELVAAHTLDSMMSVIPARIACLAAKLLAHPLAWNTEIRCGDVCLNWLLQKPSANLGR